jgi:aspartate aminotransferase
VRCRPSDGTFYAFPNVEGVIEGLDGVSDDLELAERLITDAGVAMVPGTAFGAPGYIRLSFATSMEKLDAALGRFRDFAGR